MLISHLAWEHVFSRHIFRGQVFNHIGCGSTNQTHRLVFDIKKSFVPLVKCNAPHILSWQLLYCLSTSTSSSNKSTSSSQNTTWQVYNPKDTLVCCFIWRWKQELMSLKVLVFMICLCCWINLPVELGNGMFDLFILYLQETLGSDNAIKLKCKAKLWAIIWNPKCSQEIKRLI